MRNKDLAIHIFTINYIVVVWHKLTQISEYIKSLSYCIINTNHEIQCDSFNNENSIKYAM